MIRRLNSQQKRELEEHNRRFLAEHPNFYLDQQIRNVDYEPDHSAEISAAPKGKAIQ